MSGQHAQADLGEDDVADVRGHGWQLRLLGRHPPVHKRGERLSASALRGQRHAATRHGDLHQRGAPVQKRLLQQRVRRHASQGEQSGFCLSSS